MSVINITLKRLSSKQILRLCESSYRLNKGDTLFIDDEFYRVVTCHAEVDPYNYRITNQTVYVGLAFERKK